MSPALKSGSHDPDSSRRPAGGRHPTTVARGARGAAIPWSWQLVVLFGIAWGWRLVYLYRLEHSLLAGPLLADAKTYWEWAGFLLRSGPVGTNPFFMGPLYPYVLALTRLVVGDSISGVLLVQSAWGAAAAVLLADAARRLTRPSVGIAVGLLVAGYEMAVLFDGLVLMESLLFFLECLLVWLVAREDWKTPRPLALAGVGLVIGLLAQGRATSAVLLIPVGLLLLERSSTFGRASRRFILVLAMFTAVCAPTTLHNRAVSGEWIPFTYNLGLNLFIGNSPHATGSYVDIQVGAFRPVGELQPIQDGGAEGDGRAHLAAVEGRTLGASESSRYWAERAGAFIQAHPGRAARLALRKLGMLWNWREYPQIEALYEFRAVLGILGLPLVGTFAFLGVLAIGGFTVAWRAGGAGRFMVGYAAGMSLAVLPFFVVDRYRHHLVPAAALLAAFAIEEVIRLAARPAAAHRTGLAGSLAMGIVLVGLPLPGLDPKRVAWDIATDLGNRCLSRGRPDLALPYYAEAIRIDRAGSLFGSESPEGRVARAEAYVNHATSLLLVGREDEAVASSERALQLAPGAAQIVFALGQAYATRGRLEEALARCSDAGQTPGEMAMGLVRKALGALQIGQPAAAAKLLSGAIALDTTEIKPELIRIRAGVLSGRLEDTQAALMEVCAPVASR